MSKPHKNTQQSDTHQGSGAETPDIAQQPGLAEKGNHGSVLASYGVANIAIKMMQQT